MSHYTQIKTKIMRKSALVKALKSMDPRWKSGLEVHEAAQNLYGYHGDKREQTAEIIIRRKDIGSASNDIGFKQNADGSWGAIVSDYDSGRYNQAWLDKLTQTYAKETIREIASEQGFSFEEREVAGEIHVTCTSSF